MSQWQPIETAPHGEYVLLFEPRVPRKTIDTPARMIVERWPTHYPRKASHWMPLPAPPAETKP